MAPALELYKYQTCLYIYIREGRWTTSVPEPATQGCFVPRDPLTRCCGSATYAAEVERVGPLVRPIDYSRPYVPKHEDQINVDNLTTFLEVVRSMDYSRPHVPKHEDQIDVDDLTTFFVTYMKNEILEGIKRRYPVLWGRLVVGIMSGLRGSRHG